MKPHLVDAIRRIADGLDGRLGCLVCDAGGAVWAAHRADERFAAASVIKVPILAALAAEIDAGMRRWDQVVPLDPCDDAAGSGVIQYLSPHAYTLRGRRMYDFAARAQGRENLSTPRDLADLFVRLLQGRLASPATSEIVLGILRAQQFRDKLPAWLPPDAAAAHKTGELPGVQNDCGILFLPSGPVVVAVLTSDLTRAARGRLAVQEIGRAIVEAAA